MTRKALGLGLSALIPSKKEVSAGKETEVLIEKIEVNPYQARKDFDDDDIAKLADSIKEKGLLQPVMLVQKGDKYQLLFGERRLRAFKHLKMEKIPAIIKESLSEIEKREIGIIENILRVDLNPVEEAAAYKELIEKCGLTHEDVSKKVGKDRSTITNMLRLLSLPKEARDALASGKISMGHARAILSFATPSNIKNILENILKNNLSVRDTEALSDGTTDKGLKSRYSKKVGGPQKIDPDINSLRGELEHLFGNKVNLIIGKNKKQGKIEIPFSTIEQLNSLVDRLRLLSK